jgi:hypothetical protein
MLAASDNTAAARLNNLTQTGNTMHTFSISEEIKTLRSDI